MLVQSLCVLGLISASASPAAQVAAPRVLGLILGESTLHDAVFQLGTADAAYLAGSDSEGGEVLSTDPLVMAWNKSLFLVGHEREARITVGVPALKSAIAWVSVDFAAAHGNPPSVHELEAQLHATGRRVRLRWRGSPDDLELRMGRCEDPEGQVITWVFPDLGLDAYLEPEKELVQSLRYSIERWQEGFPPQCKPQP